MQILSSSHQVGKPNPEPESRRITRSQTGRAAQNLSPKLENRRVTRSQSKRPTQDLQRKNHNTPSLTRNKPKERHRKQGEIASLNPSGELTSQPAQGVSAWLNGVQLAPIQEVRTFDQDDSYSDNGTEYIMATTSSSRSVIYSDDASTSKPRAAPKRSHQDILDKLRTRRALPDRLTPDAKTKTLKLTIGVQKAIKIPYEDTENFQTVITNFLRKAENASPGEDGYAAIEDLSNEINAWKSTVHLATITNLDFKKDLTHCEHSNEAVFQRTAMISIIDRWRLNDMFDFNCEGHWSLQGKYPLPSTLGIEDKVTGPKPDLAIFFNTESLLGSDGFSAPLPPVLKSCIFPDRASQALFNIYTWMRKAGQTDDFFQSVRLFSIAINVEKVIVRTHRAEALDNKEGLVFLCDELCTLYRYDRDDVCLLIRNILVDYGAKELCKILKNTVEEVSKQYAEGTFQNDEPSKRKNDANLDGPSKRHQTSRNAS
ncbi:hypothetical protein CHU98_g3291 [Xylaria longipes]|nr:hypothetical protein CHU98_g3291 [Xylaria longipes]